MFEYDIINIYTDEEDTVIGHSLEEACKSAGLDYTQYRVTGRWYID